MKVCKQAQDFLELLQAHIAIARGGVLGTLMTGLSTVERRHNRSLLQSILMRTYLCALARADHH